MTVIKARDGYTLTNGETYSKKIYLGIHDSPDNWHEIPDDEVPVEPAEPTTDEATLDDYETALRSLGVNL
jgi:hypothetical protein